MRYFTIVVLIIFASCHKKISQPIVDYSTNYSDNERMLSLSAGLKKQKQQTIVLIDQKESDYDTFRNLIA